MGDNTDTGLLREIDEELRQEHYSKLWARYGKAIIAAAVLLVAGVAGYKGWQAYDVSHRSELAERFSAAVVAELDGDLSGAHEAFAALGTETSGGYSVLARFRAAATLAQQGDRSGAASAYRQLSTDSAVDKQYQDMATILGALNEFDMVDPSAIISRLAPLTGADQAWRFSARELTALAALRAGDNQQAIDLFNQLVTDSGTPSGVRARARELLAATDVP